MDQYGQRILKQADVNHSIAYGVLLYDDLPAGRYKFVVHNFGDIKDKYFFINTYVKKVDIKLK